MILPFFELLFLINQTENSPTNRLEGDSKNKFKLIFEK